MHNVRIAQVIPHTFVPATDGGRQKSQALSRALAACGELHIVNYGDDEPIRHGVKVAPHSLEIGPARHAQFHDVLDASHRVRFPRSALLRVTNRGLPWRWRPASPRDAAIHQLIEQLAPDVVVADDTRWAPFAVFSRARARIIHTHNHESALWRQLSDSQPKNRGWSHHARWLDRLEKDLVPQADQVWVVRAEDDASYRGLGARHIVVTPNVVADEKFDWDESAGIPGRALFFGSLWYPPNAAAAKYLTELAGRWCAQGLDWQVRICGAGAPAVLQQEMARTVGVNAMGFSDDLKAEARQAAAILIPLALGGGTKVKTIEAMVLGKPIVTTPVGAEGLDLVDGVHALIREPGPAFDEAAARVLSAPAKWAELGRNARAFAAEKYSQRVLNRAVATALGEGLARKPL